MQLEGKGDILSARSPGDEGAVNSKCHIAIKFDGNPGLDGKSSSGGNKDTAGNNIRAADQCPYRVN